MKTAFVNTIKNQNLIRICLGKFRIQMPQKMSRSATVLSVQVFDNYSSYIPEVLLKIFPISSISRIYHATELI
jgi:hypothetical protein